MVGYVGTENGWYHDIKFEPNKTYTIETNIPLREVGFLVYKYVADVDRDFDFNDELTCVFKVEVPDDAKILKDRSANLSRYYVDRLRVLKMLTKQDIEKESHGSVRFGKHGLLTYIKYSDGTWKKWRFNRQGDATRYESHLGFGWICKFDKAGRLLYLRQNDGYWRKHRYDKVGREIYYADSTGFWQRRRYDDKDRMIYYEDSYGLWRRWRYDNNSILYMDSGGCIEVKKFDNNGSLIYHRRYWAGSCSEYKVAIT